MGKVDIIGVRGIPNKYGGFERCVEVLAPYLARRGYEVTVFCEASTTDELPDDEWKGVRRRYVRRHAQGPLGTIEYDARAFAQVRKDAVALIFGYGTAVFQSLLKARGVPHAVNMDGMEWKRNKWSGQGRIWLRANEWVAAAAADILIADHPAIRDDLKARLGRDSKMIPYGVELSAPSGVVIDHEVLKRYGPRQFFLVIARPEPENQVHVILDAYERTQLDARMVIVGDFESNQYGRDLRRRHATADFVGAIYDTAVLNELRRRAMWYLHGHSVGGTNPSLIEAMSAGAMIAAHDNRFNRWVIGDDGVFFQHAEDLAQILSEPIDGKRREVLIAAARRSCEDRFLWSAILRRYEEVIESLMRCL